jgi:hypothetical protein
MKKFSLTDKWFGEWPEEFYIDGFEKRVQQWRHCIALEGHYVERWGVGTKSTF